jgi:hypothetical protein
MPLLTSSRYCSHVLSWRDDALVDLDHCSYDVSLSHAAVGITLWYALLPQSSNRCWYAGCRSSVSLLSLDAIVQPTP